MTEPRRPRGHAAAGGRILALGLSTGAAIALAGAMANGARDKAAADVAAVTPTAPPITVKIVYGDGHTVDATIPPAPVVAAAPANVRTSGRTRGS